MDQIKSENNNLLTPIGQLAGEVHRAFKTTTDGSHTLYIPEIDETYHSVHGAIQESMHVFIRQGLMRCHKAHLSVLEIGFGTGLNALLTAVETAKNLVSVDYLTLEKYPVEMKDVVGLNYPDLIDPECKTLFLQMHHWMWGQAVELRPGFVFEKQLVDFTSFEHSTHYDLIFFDAFSPDKQPEMWDETLFARLYQHCNDQAVLVTYCAKGAVRRALIGAGFSVERVPGPPGKREMLVASKTFEI